MNGAGTAIGRILVALDGSALAERAIPYAEALAKASDARLILLQAVLTPHSSSREDRAYGELLVREARAYLTPLVAKASHGGARCEALVWEDEASRAIGDAAETEGADLVVMSTHGRSGLSRVVWGSVADRVLRRAAFPILLVPRNADAEWFDHGPGRVIVPLDGSMLAEAAIGPARLLAEAWGSTMVLFRAVEPTAYTIADRTWAVNDPNAPDPFEWQVAEAHRYLDAVAREVGDPRIERCVDVFPGGAVAAIRRAVAERQAGAIAMATHGRGGITRTVLGSVTDAVVRTARVPVLATRPGLVRVAETAEPEAAAAATMTR